MANEKYALLDTDFISKMHLIRKDDHNKLIDKIMAMPGYCFYCHKQIQVEIMRHNIAGAPEWFQSKIESKSICMYDDEMILDELSGVYGEWAISAYAGMLKTACDAYKDGYFEEKFVLVSQMDCRSISSPMLMISMIHSETADVLSVEDNGIGVKKYDLPYIFQKGFTGDSTDSRKKATGIGLYLVKKMADDLNLRLEATSQWGKGFKIVIFFPKLRSNGGK